MRFRTEPSSSCVRIPSLSLSAISNTVNALSIRSLSLSDTMRSPFKSAAFIISLVTPLASMNSICSIAFTSSSVTPFFSSTSTYHLNMLSRITRSSSFTPRIPSITPSPSKSNLLSSACVRNRPSSTLCHMFSAMSISVSVNDPSRFTS